jgi:predicted SAM-dependent methyltransferase
MSGAEPNTNHAIASHPAAAAVAAISVVRRHVRGWLSAGATMPPPYPPGREPSRPPGTLRLMAVTHFDPLTHPTRLNLGCGFDHREGYLNVDFQDFHKPDLVADVTHLDMLPEGRYVEIVAQDVLEHLPRTETQAVLGEWNRLLAPGGMLTLRIPSVVDLVKLLEAPENQGPARQEQFMQCLFGTQAYTGDVHLTSFTRPLLGHYLAEEGFEVVRWELFQDWLYDIDVRKVGESGFREEYAGYLDLLSVHDLDEFVDATYQRVLGRPADLEGRYYYAQQLQSGGLSKRGLIRALAQSDEATSQDA